jgi:DNA-binding transcriptional regulator YiaG
MHASLKARLGPRVQLRDVDRTGSGSLERLLLRRRPGTSADTVSAARALVRRHLPLRAAHHALTQLLQAGEVVVAVPQVEDAGRLLTELRDAGLDARRHAPPEAIDIRAIRARLGASQEEFALRFGLDLATLRNWEQGRSRPDTASRTLLRLIETNPGAVSAALSGP